MTSTDYRGLVNYLNNPERQSVDVMKREYTVRDDPQWPAPETLEQLHEYKALLAGPRSTAMMFHEMVECLVERGNDQRQLLRTSTDMTYTLFENLGTEAYKQWWDAMRSRLPFTVVSAAELE